MENLNKYYPMNSAELLDMVLEVYKKSFGKQLAVSIIFNILLTAILLAFTVGGGIIVVVALLSAEAFVENTITLIITAIVAVVIIFILLVFHNALITTGNALVTKSAFLNSPQDIGSIIKDSFKKIIPAATAGLANIIVMLPVYILLAIFIAMYVMLFIDFETGGSVSRTALIIGMVAVIILALLVSVVCSSFTMMSISVSIFERKYFFAAVKKSFQLVKPDFAKILGLVVVWNLIAVAASYSLTGLFDVAALFGGILPQEMAGAVSILSVGLGGTLSTIVSLLLSPLSGIFSTLMYINQRFKHEGLDIELNLSLESQRQRSSKFTN